MADVLLISEKTLKEQTLINNNIDGMYILPAIRMVQDIDLDTVIGPVLNNRLQELVATGDISDNSNKHYKDLLDDYITPYMCWACMAAIQININYKMSNSGVIQNEDEKKSRIDYASSKSLQNQYDKYASSYAMKLKNYLNHHTDLYPEYKKMLNCEGEENPQLCSIYLGNNINKTYIGK